MVFRYDEAGRVLGINAGARASTVSYDALDRVTRVTLDGDAIVDYGYEFSDEDAVAASDRRTGETLAPFASSPVFGTMASVVYARPRPSTHEAVTYSPVLKIFEATWRHLVPDALRLAALERRDLPVRGEIPMPAPFGHDRPSNALFLPPEYRARELLHLQLQYPKRECLRGPNDRRLPHMDQNSDPRQMRIAPPLLPERLMAAHVAVR